MLRVFTAAGKVAKSQTVLHRYIGEFVLDHEVRPFEELMWENEQGSTRRVIIFRLRPKGEVYERREEDAIPVAVKTETIKVLAGVSSSAMIEPETIANVQSLRRSVPATQVRRGEAELSGQFQDFMAGRGHSMTRFQIRVKGFASALLTDLYDETAHVLYEAKAASSRESIRMAIGQLMDYRRHIDPPNPALAVLLPKEPQEDPKSLLDGLHMQLIYQDGETFRGVPGID